MVGLLNYSEANRWTDFPQLGCWQPHNIGSSEQQIALAHASFVPNALYSAGLATNFAFCRTDGSAGLEIGAWRDRTSVEFDKNATLREARTPLFSRYFRRRRRYVHHRACARRQRTRRFGPQRSHFRGNRLNLDTGAVFGRPLTAAVFASAQRDPLGYLQAS